MASTWLLQHWPTTCTQVFEGGSLYSPKALDIKEDDLMSHVTAAIANVAAMSLQLGYPTLASIPHSIIHGYKNVLAVSVATEYSFPLSEKVRLPAAVLLFASSTAPAQLGPRTCQSASAAPIHSLCFCKTLSPL